MSLISIFSGIYARDDWKLGSGPGSQPENCGLYLHFLSDILHDYGVRTVLDIGCGNWAHLKNADWGTTSYLGIDVVPLLILQNIKEYQKDGISFRACSINDVENVSSFDLVIIKDVFQHLNYAEILCILKSVKLARLLLVTNDLAEINQDCACGGYRPLNMSAPPFGFDVVTRLRFQSVPFVKESVLTFGHCVGTNSNNSIIKL